MTFEEAKKILKKEGFELEKGNRPCCPSIAFTEYESPEICEAMQVVCSAGYSLSMVSSRFDDRKARLSLELAENSVPMSGPGEEQSKEGNLKAATKMFGAQAREIMRLTAENAELRETIDKMKEGNPALAESASQFNDALLDEQAKKIAELTKDKELMKKATLSQLDDFIEIYNLLTKESQKTKRLGKEIAKLNGIIHDKNAILSDVAEELRLSKIREKNLTEVCQKYVKEVEDLREQLANNVVDKIDAQALKSAESALAWKEKLIYYKDMAIADLRKELKAQKGLVNHISKKYDGAKINLNLRMDQCEKLEKELDEAKKQNTAVMVDMTAKCLRAARESINDVFESYAAKYMKSTLDDLKEKAYNSFNAKTHNLGLVGSKDGNGITDQMEEEKKLSLFRDDSVGEVTNQKDCSPIKDTHPTEDNPEEVKMDEILELVRKALEEGHTVYIDYDKAEEGGDQSATIVECGKDIDDVFKEIKRLCQE